MHLDLVVALGCQPLVHRHLLRTRVVVVVAEAAEDRPTCPEEVAAVVAVGEVHHQLCS